MQIDSTQEFETPKSSVLVSINCRIAEKINRNGAKISKHFKEGEK